MDRVFEIAGEASVGRPHVAQALLEAGYIKSMPEAFEKWLAYGGPGDVPRDKLSPEDAIGLIHAVGGLAVVAHPYEGKNVLERSACPGRGWPGRRRDLLPGLRP